MNLGTSLRLAGGTILALAYFGAHAAQAITYNGTILSGAAGYSLVHEGADVDPTNSADDWLRFDGGQAFTFDVTGLIVSATVSQSFNLTSNNGATGTLVIESMSLELDDTTGIPSGTLDYSLDGVAGTFTFLEDTFGGTVFNSSSFSGDVLTVFLWGGDASNDLGIDFAFDGAPVPVPPSLMLFGSALAGLAMIRRRRSPV